MNIRTVNLFTKFFVSLQSTRRPNLYKSAATFPEPQEGNTMQELNMQETESVNGGAGPLMLLGILFGGLYATATTTIVAINEL
ncbi:class IIb bacteriocin, lactobin A/cerein 7B family [Chitinimonas sp. BJB300]|nr:class IIb bacteriocin, lactobin A/cerein 7B family [Chitinimonas sp. BJB300]